MSLHGTPFATRWLAESSSAGARSPGASSLSHHSPTGPRRARRFAGWSATLRLLLFAVAFGIAPAASAQSLPTLSIENASAAEGSNVSFTVTLSATSSDAVTVTYKRPTARRRHRRARWASGVTEAGLRIDAATLTIADDDDPGVRVSTTTLAVTEESSGRYSLVLDTEPSGNVTVRVTVSGNQSVTVAP